MSISEFRARGAPPPGAPGRAADHQSRGATNLADSYFKIELKHPDVLYLSVEMNQAGQQSIGAGALAAAQSSAALSAAVVAAARAVGEREKTTRRAKGICFPQGSSFLCVVFDIEICT